MCILKLSLSERLQYDQVEIWWYTVEVKKDNILIVNRLMRAVKASGHANIVADAYDKGQNISFREMRKKKMNNTL